jgi:hypothetical protein
MTLGYLAKEFPGSGVMEMRFQGTFIGGQEA